MFRIRAVLRYAGRASAGLVTRLWQESPGALMAAYLTLAVAADAAARNAGMVVKDGGIPLAAFLCWRVTRGGHISRGILILFSAEDLLGAASVTPAWHMQMLAVLACSLAGLALLLSPAAYARTHPDAAASSGIRLRSRLWMILAAALAGTTTAGLCLAWTRYWSLPGGGCRVGPVQILPRHCVGSGRGFPVPVVTTVHGQLAASQLAFLQDGAQWSLLLFTAGYLLWLAKHRRKPQDPQPLQDARLVAQPSQ